MPISKAHKRSTRQRILASATELFCRQGFNKVSIGQIMSLARLTHGAFYAHFESKEALFKASVMETFARSKTTRLAKGPLSISHLLQLADNCLTLRNISEQTTAPEMILFNEIGAEKQEIRQMYSESYQSLLQLVERRMKALVKLNKIPAVADVSDRARAILASLVGAVSIARSIDDPEEQQHILRVAQQSILQLLGAADQSSEFEALSGA